MCYEVLNYPMGFPGGTGVKNPPANAEMQEAWVQSLGQEDPLEKEMATHSSTLAWEIPGTEEPGGLQSQKSRTRLNKYFCNCWALKGQRSCDNLGLSCHLFLLHPLSLAGNGNL